MKKDKRLSRCTALQIIYSSEISNNSPADSLEFICDYFEDNKYSVKVKKYSLLLVKYAQKNLTYLDMLISKKSENWEINRIAIIDKGNLIVLDMLHHPCIFLVPSRLRHIKNQSQD